MFISKEFVLCKTVVVIVSQRSSLELVSFVTKAGSSTQNLWPILYDTRIFRFAEFISVYHNSSSNCYATVTSVASKIISFYPEVVAQI